MKQRIRLTEGDLHNIIKESVNRILNEIGNTKNGRDKIRKAIANKDAKGFDNDMDGNFEKPFKANDGNEYSNKHFGKIANVEKYMDDSPYSKDWKEGR